jgi:hypothetical protein
MQAEWKGCRVLLTQKEPGPSDIRDAIDLASFGRNPETKRD